MRPESRAARAHPRDRNIEHLAVGQILRFNPAAAVRGPKYVVKTTGKIPVLFEEEARHLLESIPPADFLGLRNQQDHVNPGCPPGVKWRAQPIADHESPRTTKLYDRTTDELSLDEIERIRI